MDASSPDGSSYSQGRSNGNNKLGTDTSNKGTCKPLRERQVIFIFIKIFLCDMHTISFSAIAYNFCLLIPPFLLFLRFVCRNVTPPIFYLNSLNSR